MITVDKITISNYKQYLDMDVYEWQKEYLEEKNMRPLHDEAPPRPNF